MTLSTQPKKLSDTLYPNAEPPKQSRPEKKPPSRGVLIFRVVLTAIVLFSLWMLGRSGHGVDLEVLYKTATSFSTPALLGASALALLQVMAQTFRFTVLIPPQDKARVPVPGWKRKWSVGTIGHFLNSFTPLRTGDAYKALATADSSRNDALPLSETTGIVLAERLGDNLSLLLLVGLAESLLLRSYFDEKLSKHLTHESLAAVGMIVGAAVLLAASMMLIFRRNPALWHRARGIARNVAAAMTSTRFIGSFAFAVLAWLIEFWCFQVLCRGVGVDLSFTQSISALFAMNLGLALPLTLANLGVFEAALAVGLARFGVEASQGLAIGAVYHLIQLGTISVWALIGLGLGMIGHKSKFYTRID